VVRLDTDPEGVHQMRVGARRLRSDLRTLGPLLQEGVAEPVRAELQFVGAALGAVRDADVLAERLRRQGEALPEADRRHVGAILRRLARQRGEALREALEVLDGDRYAALLDRLVELAADPPALPTAAARAADLMPPLVGRSWQALERAVRKAGKHPSADELHRIRILAKRARYAADVAAPVAGKPARTLSSALADLQDVLGDHQDGVVAQAWLRDVTGTITRPEAMVAGQLIAAQRYEAGVTGQDWRSVWRRSRARRTCSG
jgi:CHAD domain-containing protein